MTWNERVPSSSLNRVPNPSPYPNPDPSPDHNPNPNPNLNSNPNPFPNSNSTSNSTSNPNCSLNRTHLHSQDDNKKLLDDESLSNIKVTFSELPEKKVSHLFLVGLRLWKALLDGDSRKILNEEGIFKLYGLYKQVLA